MPKRIIALALALLTAAFSSAHAVPEPPVDISGAGAVLLVCADTGDVIIEKNADEAIEAAGLKRLPALLAVCRAFDEGKLKGEEVITVAAEAATEKGATAFLSANERIAAEELLKAAVMLTAGDAILALLLSLCGTREAALEAVNAELSAIDAAPLTGSATGEGHAFTLNELEKICLELAKSGSFLRYSSTYTAELAHENAPTTELTNPNRLVRHYSGCFGLATGSVGASEYAGAFIARRGGTAFLVLLAGMQSGSARAKLASDLLDYAFSAFRTYEAGRDGDVIGAVTVTGGQKSLVEAVNPSDVKALVSVQSPKLTVEPELYESVEAPIEEGAVLGKLIIKDASGNILAEAPAVSAEAVKASSFGFWFMQLTESWLRRSP